MPAVKINVIPRPEEGKFFTDAAEIIILGVELKFRQESKYSFLYCADLAAEGIEYFQAVPP